MSDPAPAPATRPPLTLPFNSPPPLSRGVRSRTSPLYGLGWRSSYAKILRRHPRRLPRLGLAGKPSSRFGLNVGTGTVLEDRIRTASYLQRYTSEDDNDHIVCFITFNTNAKSLAALSGPDGEEFVKAAREVLKIDPQEEESFMWYRCSPVHRALVKHSQHYVRLVSVVSNFLAGKTWQADRQINESFDLAPGYCCLIGLDNGPKPGCNIVSYLVASYL
ncbi:hypothetical protein B0H14DRAFT_3597834 [Mycena olivaceomarginata]|nr:hypothetical protein B0H14DRAFT_3597834 [Mycena olivaceomarginata]